MNTSIEDLPKLNLFKVGEALEMIERNKHTLNSGSTIFLTLLNCKIYFSDV